MESFFNKQGTKITLSIIDAIEENTQYLSDIDGLIGDGDHGVNMNKGFQNCKQQLDPAGMTMSESFKLLALSLMEIGGSMGPLYGGIFRAMAQQSKNSKRIDRNIFSEMLCAAEAKVRDLGQCELGDKTLLDVLAPASTAFQKTLENGSNFVTALDAMAKAAIVGRDATVDMVAKKGRASRLGERSKGVPDAGATSCCLILITIADVAKKLCRETGSSHFGTGPA